MGTVISYHPSLVLATGCSYGRKTPGHIALHSLHVHQVVRKEKKMFSISEELQHPSMSRDSSDRSDSSTGGHPVSMAPDVKMYSNLYWEEENLEASLHGGSDSGLMESVPWELDTKDPSSSLDLELSMDQPKIQDRDLPQLQGEGNLPLRGALSICSRKARTPEGRGKAQQVQDQALPEVLNHRILCLRPAVQLHPRH